MKTIAIVTAFPPSAGSLNEYGFHLVNAFAERRDIEKVIVIADQYDGDAHELDLSSKIEIRRAWRFNCPFAAIHILKALKSSGAETALAHACHLAKTVHPIRRDYAQSCRGGGFDTDQSRP